MNRIPGAHSLPGIGKWLTKEHGQINTIMQNIKPHKQYYIMFVDAF